MQSIRYALAIRILIVYIYRYVVSIWGSVAEILRNLSRLFKNVFYTLIYKKNKRFSLVLKTHRAELKARLAI